MGSRVPVLVLYQFGGPLVRSPIIQLRKIVYKTLVLPITPGSLVAQLPIVPQELMMARHLYSSIGLGRLDRRQASGGLRRIQSRCFALPRRKPKFFFGVWHCRHTPVGSPTHIRQQARECQLPPSIAFALSRRR